MKEIKQKGESVPKCLKVGEVVGKRVVFNDGTTIKLLKIPDGSIVHVKE